MKNGIKLLDATLPMKKNSIFIVQFLLNFSFLTAQEIVNFAEHIKPIITRHCIKCHTKDNIAPFSLIDYEDVKSNATMIKYTIDQKIMPPFKANIHYSDLKNANQLSTEEIDIIHTWIRQGYAKGKEKINEKFIKSKIPEIKFDTCICMAESFEQYGIYYDQYMTFSIPHESYSERVVESIEFLPGNRKIVKHATISIDTSDAIKSFDEWDPRYGYYTFNGLGFEPSEYGWFDWNPGDEMSASFYKSLPKKCNIILSVYYGPTGIPQSDSSCFKLKFSDNKKLKYKTELLLYEKDIINDSFYITANANKYFMAQRILKNDIIITEVFPVANLICGSFEIFAKTPDKKTIKFLKINEWDFHWQRNYKLQHPVHLPKGTVLSAYVNYNNTDKNLNNASNPPVNISEGNHMYKEQLKVYFTVKTKD